MPSKQVSPAVAAEADRFEATLKASQIPEPLIDGMWDIWVANPARARGLVARFKDSGATPAVRLKDAPGAASPALLDKLTAALAVRSEEEIGQLLDQIVAQGAMGGQLKDTDKARYKSAEEARLAKTARFVADGGRPLARPVSDGHGNPLP